MHNLENDIEKIKPIQLSGCAIINDKQEILLLWKNKRQHYELPGGKVEPGESLTKTAQREAKEEIGADVQIKKLLKTEIFQISGDVFESNIFLAHLKQNQIPEIKENTVFDHYVWIPIKEFKQYTIAPNVKSLLENCEFELN